MKVNRLQIILYLIKLVSQCLRHCWPANMTSPRQRRKVGWAFSPILPPETSPLLKAQTNLMKKRTTFSVLATILLPFLTASALAQDVVIADGGLDAAIRDTLHKPTGPLTQQDLLTLTNLNASNRSIFSLEGLEFASNLVSLDLQSNFLASASIPSTLTKLTTADLSFQFIGMRNCSFPNTLTNLSRVLVKINALTNQRAHKPHVAQRAWESRRTEPFGQSAYQLKPASQPAERGLPWAQ